MTEKEMERRAQLAASRRIWLTPDCCPPMRWHKPIVMSSGRPDEKPVWLLRLASNDNYDVEIRAEDRNLHDVFPPAPVACPFCGKHVPWIVKRANPPSPLADDDDSGYCATCRERLGRTGYCACWPPWMAWEIKR